MKHSLLAVVALTGLSTAALPATPAAAAGTVTVTPSSSCGAVVATYASADAVTLTLDDGRSQDLAAGASQTISGLPSGQYAWEAAPTTGTASTYGAVVVPRCATTPVRPAPGDIDADGIADVLGIQAATGALYGYHTYPQGLGSIGRLGTGWTGITWMQRVRNWSGAGTPDKLLAVRTDGTVWVYEDLGGGHIQSGRQIGTGFGGYTNFAVIPTNNKAALGLNALVAANGDQLLAWPIMGDRLVAAGPVGAGWTNVTHTIAVHDFDGDGFSDIITIRTDGTMWVQTVDPGTGLTAPRQIGSGWGAMEKVVSTGSLDSDALSDLVARRSDGNLYRYTSTGSYWAHYVRIGVNWQGVRLLG